MRFVKCVEYVAVSDNLARTDPGPVLQRVDVPSAVERIRALQETLCHMRDEINRLDAALGSLCLTLDPPP